MGVSRKPWKRRALAICAAAALTGCSLLAPSDLELMGSGTAPDPITGETLPDGAPAIVLKPDGGSTLLDGATVAADTGAGGGLDAHDDAAATAGDGSNAGCMACAKIPSSCLTAPSVFCVQQDECGINGSGSGSPSNFSVNCDDGTACVGTNAKLSCTRSGMTCACN